VLLGGEERKVAGGCCVVAGEGKKRSMPWLLVDLGARERRGGHEKRRWCGDGAQQRLLVERHGWLER